MVEKPLKRPWRFVYSSSPDRGLWHLLKCWPKIRELDSEAELVVTYGVKNWVDMLKWGHNRQGEMAIEIERLMKQPGIVDFGKVGQKQLSKLQASAVAWLYPLDSIQATETGCITAIENMAAGNPVITTDCDCMADEFAASGVIVSLPFDVDDYVSAVEFILNDEVAYNTLQAQGFEFAKNRDWRKIAKQWENFFLSHN
jgi:glycosyltransferase involved in cell wall biosynthesis